VPGPEEAKNVTIIATPGGAIITIPSIAAEKRSSVSVAATITEVTGIMDISLTPRKYLAGVKIDIAKLDAKPATVAEPPKKVYKYLEIKAENATEADLLSATITFKIEKSWIGTKYNVSSVTLMRYTAGGWTTLDTTLVSQTATDYVFEATTPGFSYFAITAAELAAPAPLTPPTNVTPTTTPGQKPDYTWMLVVAAAIIIVVVAYWIYSRKPKYKVPEREKSKKK
jgi:PGF-pre-PGF domain-containing protein